MCIAVKLYVYSNICVKEVAGRTERRQSDDRAMRGDYRASTERGHYTGVSDSRVYKILHALAKVRVRKRFCFLKPLEGFLWKSFGKADFVGATANQEHLKKNKIYNYFFCALKKNVGFFLDFFFFYVIPHVRSFFVHHQNVSAHYFRIIKAVKFWHLQSHHLFLLYSFNLSIDGMGPFPKICQAMFPSQKGT